MTETNFENMEGEILLFFTQWMYTYKYIYECTYIHTYIYLYVHKHMYTNGRIYLVLFHGCMCLRTGVCRCIYSYFSDLFKCYCDWVDSTYRQIWNFSKVLFIIFYKQQIRKKKCSYPIHKKVNEFFVVFYGLAANWKFSPPLTPRQELQKQKLMQCP